jgi:hypothetical protein
VAGDPTRPRFVVLVAVTDARLHQRIPLTWDFDLHCPEGKYALDDDDGQDWCAGGGAVRECDCHAPHPCPRDRVLRAPLPVDVVDLDEDSDEWSPGR